MNNKLLTGLGCLLLAAALPGALAAQARDTMSAPPSVFRPLSLPAPNRQRSGSGRPGPGYWQQRADYRITATLDTVKREIRGQETIHYTNNSPDALAYLWLFLDQNICAPNSITSKLDQPPLVFLGSTFDFSCKGFKGGVTLERVAVDGRTVGLEIRR